MTNTKSVEIFYLEIILEKSKIITWQWTIIKNLCFYLMSVGYKSIVKLEQKYFY